MIHRKAAIFLIMLFLLPMQAGCGAIYENIKCGFSSPYDENELVLTQCNILSDRGQLFAEVAWTYFEKNYNTGTGLVNAAENYPYTSVGEIAAYLSAMISAHRMNILDERSFCQRVTKLIEWLNAMELYAGELPNLIYNTNTGRMVGFDMKPGSAGFSALDIGRLLTWLKVLKSEYPLFAEGIDRAVLRWNFCLAISSDDTLRSGRTVNGKTEFIYEGRLGWEAYAARGYELWGLNVRSSVPSPLRYIEIYGYKMPYDPRSSISTGVPVYLTSTPFLLEGMEFGFSDTGMPEGHPTGDDSLERSEIANGVYKIQEERYRREGIMTARSENGVDKPPYAVIGTITAEGKLWPTISRSGEMNYDLAVFSTRAIFGMWSLWDTEYTNFIMAAAACCFFEEGRGWLEGRYEKNWRINRVIVLETNAMVLESLLHKLTGPLVRVTKEPSFIDFYIRKELPMSDYPRCLPGREREDS
ncbi:DUF3131 domain-containing protein [Maridesulfovibrio frigidus]|uniref:DUF3131 domain-containing protein n=1 Tax=Maridesulfovibrio frigidus TaxID=340956 RepID=UPI00068D190E|nr:DUF3131 domain-containing protein [Maridesulfovibrio frigidus]